MASRSSFNARDVKKALRIAKDEGLPVAGFEITPDGKIVVNTAQGENAAETALAAWQRQNRG